MKRFILGILSVACVFSFAACKNQTTSDNLDDNVIDINENNNSSTETKNLEDVYDYIIEAQPENLKNDLTFFQETDQEMIESYYPGLSDISLKQENIYTPAIIGFAQEIALVEVENSNDVDKVKEIFNNIGFPLIGEGARRLVESFDQYIQAAEKVIKEGGLAKAGKDTINNFYTKLDILRGTQRTLKLGGWLELFPAIRETLQNNDINPVAKTTVGILITGTLLANSPYIIGVLGTISIGGLLDYFWEDLKYGAMTLKDFISELIKEGFTSAGGKVLDEKKCRINLNDMLQQCLIPTPKEQICKIKDLFGTAEEVRSPLVVDLDGDGVETVTAEGGVYFDHDANGFKENSGWVGQDDGILVRDINGNGIIDNGTELFGNNSVLSSGEKAVNGFEALKDLDDNNDGIFDRNDNAWNEVKIWQDKNFNGNYSNIKPANPVFA